MSWDFELVAGPYGGTTEGPVWDGEAVIFTHIPGCRLLRYDPKSGGDHRILHRRQLRQRPLFRCFRQPVRLPAGRAAYRPGSSETGRPSPRCPTRWTESGTTTPTTWWWDRSGRIWFTDPYSGIGDSGPPGTGPHVCPAAGTPPATAATT